MSRTISRFGGAASPCATAATPVLAQEAPEVIATIASGAADLDYGPDAGIIVVPITPDGRVVALTGSPMQ